MYSRKIASEDEVLRRIFSKVVQNKDCKEYMGYRNKANYGVVKIGGRNGKFIGVHRLVYEKTKGTIPEGMCVCHTCDNPPCCNPDHLFLSDHEGNMKDMANKNRAYRTDGEKSGRCKLSEKQVESIRKDSRKGTIVANEYGVVKSTISMIRNFKSRVNG